MKHDSWRGATDSAARASGQLPLRRRNRRPAPPRLPPKSQSRTGQHRTQTRLDRPQPKQTPTAEPHQSTHPREPPPHRHPPTRANRTATHARLSAALECRRHDIRPAPPLQRNAGPDSTCRKIATGPPGLAPPRHNPTAAAVAATPTAKAAAARTARTAPTRRALVAKPVCACGSKCVRRRRKRIFVSARKVPRWMIR